MRSIAKKNFRNLIASIDFPIVIYSGRSGNIIATNNQAENLLGQDMNNMKVVVEHSIRVGLSKSILAYGKKIFNNVLFFNGIDHFEVDIEINSIFLDNEYIMICFFERSYKQIFDKRISKLLPRFFYKDVQHYFRGGSYFFTRDTNVILDGHSNNQVFMDSETNEYYKGIEEQCIITGEGVYNVIHNLSMGENKERFIKMNMIPILNRAGNHIGVVGIYTLLLEEIERKTLYDIALNENHILNQIIARNGLYVVSWNLGSDWEIEYVSPNFSWFGYSRYDLYSGNVRWLDLIHPDDMNELVQKVSSLNENQGNILEPMSYRIRKLSGKYVWVLDETYNVSRRDNSWHLDCVLKIIDRREK